MAKRKRPTGASLYEFRDLDLMYRIEEAERLPSTELADNLGFADGEGTRAVGIRLAWMRRYGMVAFDQTDRHWSLTPSGQRVVQAHELAPQLEVIEQMPEELMVETMAHVVARVRRGENMLAHMLRREFRYGTGGR